MSYNCKDAKKDSLTSRLNRKITILRRPSEEEWLGTAGNNDDFGPDESTEYNLDGPAYHLYNDLLNPDAPLRDDYGQPVDTWVEVTTVWAAVEPLQGREYFAAMAENADVTTRIRIRYRAGIDRTMIARYKGIEYDILYVINPKMANVELQLMSKERQ